MKLLFKQRFFSWFDSYDIYNEAGETVYTVKGQLAWGHCFKVYDTNVFEVGMVKQRILTFMPKFDIYINGSCAGCISKEFTLFSNNYNIDYCGWRVNGNMMGWNYSICDTNGVPVASVSKELFNLTDTYSIDIYDDSNALAVLMFVLAIDAEKCSSSSNS